ncbi:MAG TPA: hypothetical protein VF731_02670 [Solirubrobacterales bacterium]
MSKMKRLLAVSGISGLLVMGVAGVAQASPGGGPQGSTATISKVDRSGPSRDKVASKDKGRKHDISSKDHGSQHERTSRL